MLIALFVSLLAGVSVGAAIGLGLGATGVDAIVIAAISIAVFFAFLGYLIDRHDSFTRPDEEED